MSFSVRYPVLCLLSKGFIKLSQQTRLWSRQAVIFGCRIIIIIIIIIKGIDQTE